MIADRDPVDVLLIGAGASGAAFTWSLSRAGIKVHCLEQGRWVDPGSYAHTRDGWELHRFTDMHPDPNVRELPADYPLNNDATPIIPLMYNAVGGSTIHWSAHFPRLHPSDFRVKTLDGVADDWPLSYAELEPYFDLNDRMMGVIRCHRRPGLSTQAATADAADSFGQAGRDDRRRLRAAWLALVAFRQRHHHARLRRPARLQ